MIRYSDYNGPQSDVASRDGVVVPFDRDAARQMAHHAHLLATDVSERAVPPREGSVVSVQAVSPETSVYA
jgi:hypothetical protein